MLKKLLNILYIFTFIYKMFHANFPPISSSILQLSAANHKHSYK